MTKAEKIVQLMMSQDAMSQWLGIDILEAKEGSCKIKMKVRSEMVNGFGTAHGGITFSLADSALAFSSNSHGQKCVSIETSINHMKPVFDGDKLIAVAEEQQKTRSVGYYLIKVMREDTLVALFKGVVFRKPEEWEV